MRTYRLVVAGQVPLAQMRLAIAAKAEAGFLQFAAFVRIEGHEQPPDVEPQSWQRRHVPARTMFGLPQLAQNSPAIV
jgi:hypothetical protein